MTPHRRVAMAVAAAVLATTACTAGDGVTPQPCERALTSTGFRVCLPGDATIALESPDGGLARVDEAEVHLLEVDAQPGDADQAAFAVLATLQAQVGSAVPDARSADPVGTGEEGPVDVDGADGAFQSFEAVYDTGEVDDVATWGRAIVVDGRAAAVLVVRDWASATEVDAEQAAAGRADALPIVVSLTAT